MSALDRIRRVTLLDVKPGDLLIFEVATGPRDAEEFEMLGAAIREELQRIGHSPDEIGVLVTGRGDLEAKIVRAGT